MDEEQASMFGSTSDQPAAEGPARFAEQADFLGHVSNERRIGEYLLPAAGKIEHCRSCGAQIVWTRTPNSRAIPLSLATIQTREGKKYALSHFSDCPHAKDWSKQKARSS